MLQGNANDLANAHRVLSSTEGPAFEIVNSESRNRIVLVCEHAGRAVPAVLQGLGLAPEDFDRHIAYDVGAAGVARAVAAALDAPLVLQPYSRLVVDSNRGFDAPDCFPEVSDTIAIPGNRGLSEKDRRARYEEIHTVFHRHVSAVLDSRADPEKAVLVSIHSFTPRLLSTGIDRPWEIGLLFNRDGRLAQQLMPVMRRMRPGIVAAFNEPYRGGDATDYTIPVHGERRGIEHVLVEIRNDLIGSPDGQFEWAALLAAAVREATEREEEPR